MNFNLNPALFEVVFRAIQPLAGRLGAETLKTVLLVPSFLWPPELRMNLNLFAICVYGLSWVTRVRGWVRRGRQPFLRGREWFFDVHVRPGFYEGEGKRMLHRYWVRMFAPMAIEIPAAIAIFISRHVQLVYALILGMAAIIHINHVYSVELAERQARPFAVPEEQQPVRSITLSLTPRRLGDYTNPKVEWALAACAVFSLAGLAGYYFAAPEHHNLRLVFWVPLYCLYVQAGAVLVKQIVVNWRTPVPYSQATEYVEAREETRKFYLRQCDWLRGIMAGQMVIWPIQISASQIGFEQMLTLWLVAAMAVCIGLTIWVEIKRRQLVKLAMHTLPVALPDFLHEREIAKWPVCYQPSAPMLILRGARGYSLNLANTLAYFGAAYLLGFAALFALIPKGH